MSVTSAITEAGTDATTSATYPVPTFDTVQELEEEVVLLFYNSMLNLVVKDWRRTEEESVEDFVMEELQEIINIIDFKDLTNEDLQSNDVVSVSGSKISLVKKSKSSVSKIFKRSKSGSLGMNTSSKRLVRRNRASKVGQTSFPDDSLSFVNPFDWVVETKPEDVIVTFRNGNVYRGPVVRKRFHGEGVFRWADGTVYEGEFADGEITGRGKLVYKDLSYYIGEFCRGYLHGKGTMFITPISLLYSGNWKAGKKHGKGWLFYNPNNWYDGEWQDDLRHGKGTRQYDRCSMYKGDWFNGVRHGHGTMVWSNHDYYCGEWKNGTMDGYGEYIWKAFFNKCFAFPIINKFEGNWVEGTRTGEGVLNFGFIGGARMAGYWVRNMKHGPAVVICGNGKTMAGKPLFLYDKPVEPGVWYRTSRHNSETSKDEASVGSTRHATTDSTTDTGSSDSSHKCSHESVSLVAFPKTVSKHINPLIVPVHYEPKQVDLSYYVQLLVKKYEHIGNQQVEAGDHDFHSKLVEFEEDKLRNVIASNYLPLKSIYYQYSYIATKDPPRYKPVLIRLFLWQLYFDMDISVRGLSLVDTDLCLIENPDCGLETEHDPFEKIYMWQFIQSLLAVSWKLYGDSFELDTVEGTLAKILRKFIYDDVLPNTGKRKGTALCEYKDLLPIQSVYMLYRSIGDPPTARKLYKSCILKGYPLCSEKILEGEEIKYLKAGSNVTAIGATIIYLPDEQPIVSSREEPTPYPFKHDNLVLRNLHVFTKMKRKKLIECIAEICPPILSDGMIVNMDYPISFLEFYNIILLITCTKIDDVLNREALREQMKLIREQPPLEASPKPSKNKMTKKKK